MPPIYISSPSPLDDPRHFKRLPKPKAGDWLAEREESGQTFAQYVRRFKSGGMVQRPRENFDKILIVLVGRGFKSSVGQLFLPLLLRGASAYFHPMPVELHPEEIPLKGCKSRENDVGGKQYLIGDIFDAVRRSTSRIHSSYATMAITMSDIYPGEEWNYVFGQARLDERVGVFSFARHSPFFYDGTSIAELSPSVFSDTQLGKFYRSCSKTLHHEILHMLQFKHCIYYKCLINGSNGPHESSGAGMECVICEKKLIYFMSLHHVKSVTSEINVALERYREISKALAEADEAIGGLTKDKKWVDQRIAWLEGGCSECSECADDAKVVESKGEPRDVETTRNGDPQTINTVEQLSSFISLLSPSPFVTFRASDHSMQTPIVNSILKYALAPQATLPEGARSRNIGTNVFPTVYRFLFEPDTISAAAHFDWWMFPGKYNGGSLFAFVEENIFRVTERSDFKQLLETEIVLTYPDAQPQTIPYPLLIFLSIKSLIRKHPIGGIRLEKVHVFLTNVISVSSSKKVKDEAMNIASALPRSRIPKAMLF